MFYTVFNNYADRYIHSSETFGVKIVNAYFALFRELFQSAYALVPNLFSRVLHIMLLVLMVIESIIWLIKSKDVGKKILYIILCLVLPLCINCMFVITDSSAVHTLVLYGFVSIYVLVITIHQGTKKFTSNLKYSLIGKDIITAILVFCCCINICLANKAYLELTLKYENMHSFYTSLVTQIKLMPEFSKDSKIAIIGKNENNIYDFSEFKSLGDLAGIAKYNAGINIRNSTKQMFMKYYLGFDVEFATEDEIEKLSFDNEVLCMEEYPYYGSIKAIGDYLEIKLGD